MKENPRLQAVQALVKVHRYAQTLDQALPLDTPPLVRELVSGSLRHHFSLSQRIDELLNSSAVILVSHNMESITRVCTSGVYLKEGKIERLGNIDEVIAKLGI